jgi:RimJ/RimL family protein N-acetyltransferase
MKQWQPEILEDHLLKMVPLLASDFDVLFAVAADPLIWEQHPAKDRYQKEVFLTYFNKALSERHSFVMIEKSTQKIIGSTCYYYYKPEDSSIAIGYTFFGKQYWGKGYNQSSKKLLIDYAFKFVDKIYFHIGSTNFRSQIATKRIGAVQLENSKETQKDSIDFLIQKKDWQK